MTGYLVRDRNRVAEAVAAFGPTKDLGYLWSYMHGADDIEATEACAHLEVVRLYSAPVARKPYPSYAEEEATRKTQEAKPAPAVVAASMQELGQQSFMHLWMSYLDKKAEVEDLRERLAAAPAAPAPAWQPIETAPKNCVDVLLNIPGRQPVVAAFYRGGWAPVDLGGNHLRGTPTHWMPLPEAPAIAASKESGNGQ
jgi:hypothetical protein